MVGKQSGCSELGGVTKGGWTSNKAGGKKGKHCNNSLLQCEGGYQGGGAEAVGAALGAEEGVRTQARRLLQLPETKPQSVAMPSNEGMLQVHPQASHCSPWNLRSGQTPGTTSKHPNDWHDHRYLWVSDTSRRSPVDDCGRCR